MDENKLYCSHCGAIIEDDDYHLDGYDYCSECYHEEVDRNKSIHDYSYKPEPIFYGDSKRYFGVELEIDGAGRDSDNADEILTIANRDEEHTVAGTTWKMRCSMFMRNCSLHIVGAMV